MYILGMATPKVLELGNIKEERYATRDDGY